MKIIIPASDQSAYATFQRATVGTYVTKTGLIKTAAIDVPRYENGSLLYEDFAWNRLIRSEEIDNATWVKDSISVTGPVTSPDGTSNAETIAPLAASGTVYRNILQTYTTSTQGAYTASIFVKIGTLASSGVALAIIDQSGTHYGYANFDLFSLAVPTITIYGGSWVAGTATVRSIGSGWVRLSISVTTNTAHTSIASYVYLGSFAATPDTIGTVHVWGAQLETGSSPTSYIATTTAAVQRFPDSWGAGYIKSVDPTSISDAVFVVDDSQNYPYTTTLWNPATSYSLNALVYRVETHRIYKRLVAGTSATAPESDAVNWLDYLPTNKLSSVDGSLSTGYLSYKAGVVYWTTLSYSCDSIAMLGVTAGTICKITVHSAAGGILLYSAEKTFSAAVGYSIENTLKNNWVVTDVPVGASYIITVSAEASASTGAAIAELVFGTCIEFGNTQYGAAIGISDYSRKSVDEFGVATIVERKYAKTLNANVMIDNADLSLVSNALADTRATPCVYVGAEADGYESTVIYGWCRNFSIAIAYPNESVLAIEIEGLT